MLRTFALALIAVAGCTGGGGGGGGCPDPVAATVNETSLLFEGGHVEIDGALLTAYEDATLEAWIRIDDASAGDFQIAGKGGVGDGPPSFAVFIRSGDRISAGFAQQGGGFELSSVASSNLPEATWTHVAVAWSTSALSFFVNGDVLVNTTTVTGPTVASTAPIFIGGGLDDVLDGAAFPGAPFPGAIDEVRLWAGARETNQILADYDTMLTGLEPDLLGAWNFEESGRRVADLSPAASCGTISGEAERITDTPF